MGIRYRLAVVVGAVCLALAVANVGQAQQTPSSQYSEQGAPGQQQASGNQAKSPEQNNDSEILSVVHAADQIGMQAGQLAQQRSQSPEVRSVADRIISDSQKTEQRVRTIAAREGLSITNPPPAAQDKLRQADQDLARMQTLQGEEFDKAFLDFNRKGDQEAMQALKMKENQGTSPEVRDFLNSSVLPILQQHVNESNDTKKGLDNQGSNAHR